MISLPRGLCAVGLANLALASHLIAQAFAPAGDEFEVNISTTNQQLFPAVGVDVSGFVIAWRDGATGPYRITARRFAANGSAAGGEFQIGSGTFQDTPSIAMGLGGTPGAFVVVWTSYVAGVGSDVYGQRFGADGRPLGDPFRVNTYTTGGQTSPAVATEESGDFVVVWLSYNQEGKSVRGQRFSSTGEPAGSEFRVNAMTTTDNFDLRLAGSPSGFVVVWTAYHEFAIQPSIVGRRYSTGGAPLGPEFQVDTSTGSYHVVPAVSAAAGEFVVAWLQYPNVGFPSELFARRFAATGAPLTDAFLVDGYTTGSRNQPGVAVSPLGDFLVSWSDSRLGTNDVFAQRYDAGGAPAGAEFRVNTYSSGSQANLAVAASSKQFVLVWGGHDADLTGIFARRYCRSLAGDANADDAVNVADVFYLVNYLFAGGPAPVRSADANGDGTTDVRDVFYLIDYMFAGGPSPVCLGP
jgi:hypothetical protein